MRLFPVWTLAIQASVGALAQTQTTPYYGVQPTPEPCYGDLKNHTGGCLPGYNLLRYQDNTIIRRPGKNGASDLYFRFSKGDVTGDGINVATAPSLNGTWHLNFTILGQRSDIVKSDCVSGSRYKGYNWPNTNLNRWAPEIHYFNNQYYLFYTVENQEKGECFDQCVATSLTMDNGTWTDHGTMNLPDNNHTLWRRIDGNILADASDPQGVVAPYMAFNSWGWGIYGVELNSSYLTAADNAQPQLLIKSQSQPGGNKTEGAYQIRNNGYIYLFYSRGLCCSAGDADPATVYVTQVCRTKASTPSGPYVDRSGADCTNGPSSRPGSTFLYSSKTVWEPGSVSVLLDPREGLIMTYQYIDTTRTDAPWMTWGWNYLKFDTADDGWPKLTQTRT